MGRLIEKILKELFSPGNHLIIYFIILFSSFLIGIICSHFFKGNKEAETVELYAEKVIEHETGFSLKFDHLDEIIFDHSELPESTLSIPDNMP